jgi:hypothetical protein
MRALLPLGLLLCLCTGCFVLDEIDKGHAIMDQHASPERREKEAAEAAAREEQAKSDDDAGLVAGLQEQVANLGGWIDDVSKEDPAERDASDGVVRCQISGRTQFLRKSDCRVRGGKEL